MYSLNFDDGIFWDFFQLLPNISFSDLVAFFFVKSAHRFPTSGFGEINRVVGKPNETDKHDGRHMIRFLGVTKIQKTWEKSLSIYEVLGFLFHSGFHPISVCLQIIFIYI